MMNGNLSEGLSAAEFEIGGARFKVSKLPAMAAFNLLEQIRREVGRSTSEIKASEDPDATVGSMLQVVLSLEPAFVDQVRRKLFENVVFSNERAVTPQPLGGAEDLAFEGLEPVAVYEVLARSLSVNFSASLRAAASWLNGAGTISSLSSLLDSHPSSPG